MIPDRTHELIAQRLAITSRGDHMLRAERRLDDRPISVYFFDFSQDVLSENFNLSRYLQDQLASDFYRHEGSLQWNYYLYFVLPKAGADRLWASKRAVEIESDRAFARKFVRDHAELDAEFRAPLAPLLRESIVVPDIAAKWVAELSSIGLEKIADADAKYTDVVASYLASDAATVSIQIPAIAATPQVANGSYLRELDPVRFRRHPVRRNYRFGRVNLIRGSNGAGKTSLLEAVELAICGGLRRQGGGAPEGANLLARFDADSSGRTVPENSMQAYRQRDLAWYGAYRRRGNQLCENFARFNFFDSDAAFELSAATNDNAVERALRSLFIGTYATTIEERMRQCWDRFLAVQAQTDQQVKLRKSEIEKANLALAQVRDVKDTRDALLQELQVKVDACNWKKVPARLKLDELATLLEEVQGLSEQFEEHGPIIPWISRPSIATLSADARKLAQIVAQFTELARTGNNIGQSLIEARGGLSECESEQKLLARLIEYHEKPERFGLRGASATMDAIHSRIRQLREAAAESKGINLQSFLQLEDPIGTILKRERSEVTKRRKNLVTKKTQIEILEKEMSVLQALVGEIKGLGRRFCETHPVATECPLCGALHSDLAAKIAALKAPTPSQNALRLLSSELRAESETLSEGERRVAELERLRRAADLVGPADSGDEIATSLAASRVAGIADTLAAEVARHEEMHARVARLRTAGYAESELAELLDELETGWSHSTMSLQSPTSVRAALKAREAAADKLKGEIKGEERKLKENQEARARLIRPILGEAAPDEANKLLSRRQAAIDDVLTRVGRAQRTVAVADNDEFSSVARSLAELGSAIIRIQEKLQRVETKDVVERQHLSIIVQAEAALNQVTPTLVRATRAVSLLERLLKTDFENNLLAKALDEQRTKISTIFSRIHSPHEFESVNVSETVTTRRKGGGDARITEISTGQRAALALSIFLSMNSGVGAKAPWLLFDDPVVHVDDLNILSFLDLLREMALTGRRQVFFATANARVADLFTRKFDCLGEEFVTISLQRDGTHRE